LQHPSFRGNEVGGEAEPLAKKQFARLMASVPRWKSQAKPGQRLDRFWPHGFLGKNMGRLRLTPPKRHVASADVLLCGQNGRCSHRPHSTRSRSTFALVFPPRSLPQFCVPWLVAAPAHSTSLSEQSPVESFLPFYGEETYAGSARFWYRPP